MHGSILWQRLRWSLGALALTAGCGGAGASSSGTEEDLASLHTLYWVAAPSSGPGHLLVGHANPGSEKALCPDGSHRDACSIQQVDWSALHLSETEQRSAEDAFEGQRTIIRGKLDLAGKDAVLRVVDAWRGAKDTTADAPTASLFKATAIPASCAPAPCRTAHAIFLNSAITGDIVGVTFGAGLSSTEAAAARSALEDDKSGIVVMGDWDGPDPLSLTLHATKAYVPVVHASPGSGGST